MQTNPFQNIFGNTPEVIKNLIIINGIMLLATFAFEGFMVNNFALFYPESPLFRPYQILTHMFMHGGFMHFFFNMYALWMFGRILEEVWGGKRFLFYYLVTGLGAVALHLLVLWFQVRSIESTIDPTVLMSLRDQFDYSSALEMRNSGYIFEKAPSWTTLMLVPTLGASGAVFGVLLAFGVMFPNTVLQLIFPPVMLKAKWFVIIFGVLELVLGFSNSNSGVAHFAHVGGMIFGYLIIMYWRKKGILYNRR